MIDFLIRRFRPELLASNEQLRASIKSLGEKLKHERKCREEWRQRCFSAESAFTNLKADMGKRAKEHFDKHGATGFWL